VGQNPEFFSKSEAFFGRRSDLEILAKRVGVPGLTFVAAPPKMGKTWLLLELARQLSVLEGDPQVPAFLVGYHECKSGEDLLRYTLQDLYTRWLQQASMLEQARKVWSDQKGTWLSRAATAVAGIFGDVAPVTAGISGIVQKVIDGLIAANDQLKSGPVDAPVLAYDQGRDLVNLVAKLSGRPIVLIFDAWEKSGNPASEVKFLTSFLDSLEDWGRVHFIVGVRHPDLTVKGEDTVWRDVKSVEGSNGAAWTLELDSLQFDAPEERRRVLDFLRSTVPASVGVPDDELLGIVNGYPGTIGRWLQERNLVTVADLRRSADDAQRFRYAELDNLLPALSPDQRTLAMRLCLLPRTSAATWPKFRTLVEEGLKPDGWLEWPDSGLLVSTDPGEGEAYPSFGHDTRHQAVALWFAKPDRSTYLSALRKEANRLVIGLGARVDFALPEWAIYSGALNVVARTIGPASLSPDSRLVASASSSYSGGNPGAALLDFERWSQMPEQRRQLGPFFAWAFYNGIVGVLKGKELELASKLLAQLRGLQRDFPDELNIRVSLARILVNLVFCGGVFGTPAQAMAFLDELRELKENSAEATGVWREFGLGLQIEILAAQRRGEAGRVDALFAELVALPPVPPDGRDIQDLQELYEEAIGDGADVWDTPKKLASWVNEVRQLCSARPAEPYFRKSLARALQLEASSAIEKEDDAKTSEDLRELFHLYSFNQEDPYIAERIVMVASLVCIQTPVKYVLEVRRPLLKAITAFVQRFPSSKVIRSVVRTLRDNIEEKIRMVGPEKIPDKEASLADLHSLIP
jgi:hypothetical protein